MNQDFVQEQLDWLTANADRDGGLDFGECRIIPAIVTN
jgi:hypothetical protein